MKPGGRTAAGRASGKPGPGIRHARPGPQAQAAAAGSAAPACWAITPTHLRLHLRVTPRAARTGLTGIADGALLLRLRAPPVDGAANDALIAFLSEALGVRKSAIRIAAGETARHKTLHIEGDPGTLAARLRTLLP